MARPARYNRDLIINSAASVIAESGPASATIARIAQAVGAPTGSIYHRFASRNELLGEVWLRTVAGFQNEFVAHLAASDPKSGGLAAVHAVPRWVRNHPQEARILLLYRSEDFLQRGWSAEMATQAKKLRLQMKESLHEFCQRLLGRSDAISLQIVGFALAEAPLAALRGYAKESVPPPPIIDELLEGTYRAAMSLLGVRG